MNINLKVERWEGVGVGIRTFFYWVGVEVMGFWGCGCGWGMDFPKIRWGVEFRFHENCHPFPKDDSNSP